MRKNDQRHAPGPVAGAAMLVVLLAPPATAATIIGTPGDDRLTGTAEPDEIAGGHGADVVEGLEGADLLRGGPGDDHLWGGDGDDDLKGDAGADALFGERGDDVVRDGEGDDLLNGGEGNDHLLSVDGGANELRGSWGADVLRARGTDEAFGGPDDDVLHLEGVAATGRGGDGEDTVHLSGTQGQSGYGGPGNDLLDNDEGVPVLGVVPRLFGGPGDDGLSGFAVLRGGPGNDVLSAGTVHTLPRFGGDGDDTLYLATAYDPHANTAHCGAGQDTVVLDLEDTAAADCEVFSYRIWGTSGDDVLDGTAHDDHILTFTGLDIVRSGAGNDTVGAQNRWGSSRAEIHLGPGDDTALVNGGDSVDHVSCGDGVDTVAIRHGYDVVDSDCEHVVPPQD